MNFEEHYIDWRRTRINFVVKHYGVEFFKGKTILELGAGYGHIGNYFHSLGSIVTCSDAREEHLEIIKMQRPYLQTLFLDAEKEWENIDHYDIIIHWGLLYHLSDIELSLKNAIKHCKYLFLETTVNKTTDPDFIIHLVENQDGFDTSKNGKARIPSDVMIENILKRYNVKYTRFDSLELNSGIHIYDWKHDNNFREHRIGKRRFWLCETV